MARFDNLCGENTGSGTSGTRKRRQRILRTAAGAVLAGLVMVAGARADTVNWTGTTDSLWATGTNWSTTPNVPATIDDLVFGEAPVNKTVDLGAAAQFANSLTFNNTTGSYLLSNGSLSLNSGTASLTHNTAAGVTTEIRAQISAFAPINVTGGTLFLSNYNTAAANSLFTTINVSNGARLQAVGGVAGTISSINGATVALNNGNFRVASLSVPVAANDLLELHYANDGNWDPAIAQIDPLSNTNSILAAAPGLQRLLTANLNFTDGDIDVRNDTVNDSDAFATWTGTMTVGGANMPAGEYSFATRTDDGSSFFIDTNQNGVFEPSERVVENLGGHGDRSRAGTRTLAAGTYNIAMGWYDSGGGGRASLAVKAGAVQAGFGDGYDINAGTDGWITVNPTLASQAGIWNATRQIYSDFSSNNFTVDGISGIEIAGSNKFGTLSMAAGSTLNVTGPGTPSFSSVTLAGSATINLPGAANFGNLSIPANATLNSSGAATFSSASLATGTLTFNNTGSVRINNTLSGATLSQITKSGTGAVGFQSSVTPVLGAGINIDVNQGVLSLPVDIGTGLNGATLRLAGGTARVFDPNDNGLRQSWFNRPVTVRDGYGDNGVFRRSPSNSNTLLTQLKFDNDGQFLTAAGGGPLGNNNPADLNDYSFLWEGVFTPPSDGTYSFGVGVPGQPGNDDDSAAYIDLNGNGIYDIGSGERIFERGCCGGAEGSVLLQAGRAYKIAFANTEFGGGAAFNASFSTDGGASWTLVNPSDSNQAGYWHSGSTNLLNLSSTAVQVTASSGLQVLQRTEFGALTVAAGTTLSLSGGGEARFPVYTLGTGHAIDVAAGTTVTLPNVSMAAGETLNITGFGNALMSSPTLAGSATIGLPANATVDFLMPAAGSTLTINNPNATARNKATISTTLVPAGALTISNSGRLKLPSVTGGTLTQLTKTGAGVMEVGTGLTSVVNSSSTININQGTLQLFADSSNGANGATLSLGGGTLRVLDPSQNGLRQSWFTVNAGQAGVNDIGNGSSGGLLAMTPAGSNILTGQLRYENDAEFRAGTTGSPGALVQDDNYSFLWEGVFRPQTSGVYRFGIGSLTGQTNNDDDASMYVDLDADGVFETNAGERMFTRGCCGDTQSSEVYLEAGEAYKVAFAHAEGGGGSVYNASFMLNGGGWTLINPSAQPGQWHSEKQGILNFSSSAVQASGNSTIEMYAERADFGALSVAAGATLNTTGYGIAAFTGSTFAGAATLNVGANTGMNIKHPTGALDITKTGPGALYLEADSAAVPTGTIAVNTGSIVVTGSSGLASPLGTASVTMAGGTSAVFNSKGGDNTFASNITATGNISMSSRVLGPGTATNTKATVAGTVSMPAASTLTLSTANGNGLQINAVNFAGAGTITSTAGQPIVGPVTTSPADTLTLSGAGELRVTGNVTTTQLNLTLPRVTTDPGVANTLTINAPVSLGNSALRASSGTTTTGVISGQSTKVLAGLREYGYVQGNPPGTVIYEGALGDFTFRGITNRFIAGNDRGYWDTTPFNEYATFAYVGQIYVPDNNGDGTGSVAFGENIDDATIVKIDGVERLKDTTWNTPRSSGELLLTAGWHNIEVRFGDGCCGQGPDDNQLGADNGWSTTKGFGFQTNKGLGFDAIGANAQASRYDIVVDPGNASFLRVLDPSGVEVGSGVVRVEPGATLQAEGMTLVESVSLAGTVGNQSILRLSNASPFTSTVSRISLNGESTIDTGTDHVLSASILDVPASGILTKTGNGTLKVGSAALGASSTTTVVGGRLEVNGPATGGGAVIVQTGAQLGGNGSLSGPVTVQTGGAVAPHRTATATDTLSFGNNLTLQTGITLDFTFGVANDKLVVDGVLDLQGNGTLRGSPAAGFTVGEFVFLDYDQTEANTIGANTFGFVNNGLPTPFSYSVVHDTTNGLFKLVVEAVNKTWTGAASSSWEQFAPGSPFNWNGDGLFQNLQGAIFNDTAANKTVNVGPADVAPASIVIDTSVGGYSISAPSTGVITGNTGMTKRGTATLTLRGAHTFGGGVVVEDGVLDVDAVADQGVASPLGTGAGVPTITLGAATTAGVLKYSGALAGTTNRGLNVVGSGGGVDAGVGLTITGAATSSGTLVKTGAGDLVLNSTSNALNGGITVNQGKMSLRSIGNAPGSPLVTLVGGTTLEYTGSSASTGHGLVSPTGAAVSVTNAATNLTLRGPVTGNTIVKQGPGTLSLSGQATLTDVTHQVSSGEVRYLNGANSIGGTYNVNSSGTLGIVPGGVTGTTAINLDNGSLRLVSTPNVAGMDGSNMTLQGSTVPTVSNGVLTLTPAVNSVRASAFLTSAQDVTSFVAKFQYKANHGGNPADGAAFVVQNDARGATAISDGGGGDLALGGGNAITPSVAVVLNIYGGNIASSTQLVTNGNVGGARPNVPTPAGLNLAGANPINVLVSYQNGLIQWTLQDSVTLASQTITRSVDLAGTLGATTGYVGFAGATGGLNAEQLFSNFSLGTATSYSNPVNVAAGSTGTLIVDGLSSIGTTTVGLGGTLKTAGIGSVQPSSVVLPAAGTYTLEAGPGTTLVAGQVNAGANIVTIEKTGNGIATLVGELTPGTISELAAGSIINVNAGTLAAVGGTGRKNPLGAAVVNISGGTLGVSSTAGDLAVPNQINVTTTGTLAASQFAPGVTGAPTTISVGAVATPVSMAAGSNLSLAASDNYKLHLAEVQVNGNATLTNNNNSNDITVGHLNVATGMTATMAGNRVTKIVGPATGGTVIIPAGTQTAFDPGAALVTATSNVQVQGTMSVRATGGANVYDFGTATITGSNTGTGLWAGEVNNSGLDRGIANPKNRPVAHGTPMANTQAVNQPGSNPDAWDNDSMWVYTGQILALDNTGQGVSAIAFGKMFDDDMEIKIDGVVRLLNYDWSAAVSTGQLNLTPGWHDIEVRLHQGGGGAGPSGQKGWPNNRGLGVQFNPLLGFDPIAPIGTNGEAPGHNVGNDYDGADENKYVRLEELPTALFRHGNAGENILNIEPGATLKAGDVTAMQAINVNGTATLGNVGTQALTVGNGTNAALVQAKRVRGDGFGPAFIRINDNATLELTDPSAGASEVLGVSFAGNPPGFWQGKLDLKASAMVVQTAAELNPLYYAQLLDQVTQGRNGGTWDGIGGITSSTIGTDPGDFTSVAVIMNRAANGQARLSSVGGVAMDANSIIVRYTYNGDADGNGRVDIDDYFAIDTSYAIRDTIANPRWDQGNFDYDNDIDADDYFKIDAGFLNQGAPLGSNAAPVAPTAAVPEPATLSLLALGAAGLLGRRRRSR